MVILHKHTPHTAPHTHTHKQTKTKKQKTKQKQKQKKTTTQTWEGKAEFNWGVEWNVVADNHNYIHVSVGQCHMCAKGLLNLNFD